MDRLIHLLRQNARFTNEQLATMTGMAVEEVVNQIAKYEKEGVIQGYSVILDEEKADKDAVSAIIEVRVTPQPSSGYDDIARTIAQYSEVDTVTLMSGGYDLAITVNGTNLKDISLFVSQRLAPIPGVLSTATHFVLKRYKEKGIFIDTEELDQRNDLVTP